MRNHWNGISKGHEFLVQVEKVHIMALSSFQTQAAHCAMCMDRCFYSYSLMVEIDDGLKAISAKFYKNMLTVEKNPEVQGGMQDIRIAPILLATLE